MGYSKRRLVKMSEEAKLKILHRALGASYTNSKETLFHCPKCDHHKKKLSVNLEKNVFKCWVCDWSGRDIYRIVRRYADYESRKEWKRFSQEVEISNFADVLFSPPEVEVEQVVDLPSEFVSLANKKLPKTAIYPINYLESRGVKKSDIIKWKIGYCSTGKYAGRVIVPSFGSTGQPNYFVSRSYDNNWKKYLNPTAGKNIIFNELYLDFDEDLVIVEGVFDALVCGDNAVPLLGSTLTEGHPLFEKIVQNDTPVYLALDHDASKKSDKIALLFLKYDIEVHQIDTADFADVGEMSKEQFLHKKSKAVFLSHDNYLYNRISGL